MSEPCRVIAYIGLGSNLEARADHLRRACDELRALPGVHALSCSPLYQTAPMGPSDQPDYINAVCRIETTLPAIKLLDALQAIEASHGRVRRSQRWTARPLDLDILLYGKQTIASERLQVPHPGVALRSFVLKPLADLDPELQVPGVGAVAELLEGVAELGIRPYAE